MLCFYLDEESDENTCDGHRERISLNSILSDDGIESHISVPTTPSSNGNPDTAIDNFIRGTSGYESGESGKISTRFSDNKLNSDFCSRQSVSSTPLAPRKVTRHKIQNRPGHDGQGYPDFRISSDDSDNERIIAQKHQMRADRPETKHMSTDMTNLTEKQAKKPVAMRQYSLPRSVFISIINIDYII